jgi:hypothetical protein
VVSNTSGVAAGSRAHVGLQIQAAPPYAHAPPLAIGAGAAAARARSRAVMTKTDAVAAGGLVHGHQAGRYRPTLGPPVPG